MVVSFAHYSLVAKKPLTATIAFVSTAQGSADKQTSIAVFEELRPVLTGIPQSIAECLQQILSAKRIGAFIRTRDVDYHGQPLDHVSEHVAENPLFIRGKITWDISSGSNLESVDLGAPANPQQFFKLDDIDVVFPRGQVTLIAGKVGAGKTLMLLALLGEAHLIEGDISYAVSEIKSPLVEQSVSPGSWDLIPSGVAYVPQTAWLQSQSIRSVALSSDQALTDPTARTSYLVYLLIWTDTELSYL